ncbi:MAG: dihydropteroate synthase [Planctomycetes bacterium]|nr:dihydropteroate synthase [Planctomycetota bacterium]
MTSPLDLLRVPQPLISGGLPLVMGIVNVTPDSFSDGGRHDTTDAAVAHGLTLIADGADILDVGGESTRPGASPVTVEQEQARIVPVIRALCAKGGVPISVDTRNAATAQAALDAGARIVNDVSAATHDAAMLKLCAQRRCVLILMHMKGEPSSMQQEPKYEDVVREVRDYLAARVEAAVLAGCAPERIWVDPGFGFGKLPEHNFALVKHLDALKGLGPVVLGVSRKSSLGKLTGRPVEDREPESLAAGLIGALKGAAVLRVHEVGWMKRALKVAHALW